MTHQQAVEKHAAERYLLDEMAELERYDFESHFFDCAECAESVRIGALMQEGVRQGLLPDAVASTPRPLVSAVAGPAAASAPPVAVAKARVPGRGWLPWAVAATLAVGIGYQSLWIVPGLRDQAIGPQALAPVTLRPATRGPGTIVAHSGTGPVSFAVDLAGLPADTSLAYDLRTADGRSVASGTAAAPSPGTPLLLLMPGSAVRVAGGYTLSVRAEDDPESLPVDFRFTITDR
ncbi:MAG: hypothetical protein OEW19_08105 [Acidobacteriota bacterium]|nr:hypothetical protein [Acidobacteriota bacterium]